MACATVGGVTYLTVHRALMRQVDQQLAEASQRYTHCEDPPGDRDEGPAAPSRRPPPPCSPGEIPGQMQGTLTARVSHGQVKDPAVTAETGYRLSTADKAILAEVAGQHGPVTHSLSDLGPYRLVSAHASAGGRLVTGLPLESVDNTLRNVEIAELAVFSAALLCTGILGTGLVRLSLRPLRRVAATATRVTQLPLASGDVSLTERVPDTDPRTEVGQVGAALNRMLGHVEAALARRAASETRLRRFAADASHELRTPLAAIRGYAELAQRHPGPVPDEIAHALSRVESESARMSVLVDELLLLAQLDAGRPLAADPVDLSRLAIDATSDARAAGPGHRWQLDLPGEPVTVRGDEHRLRQVLANLVGNATKHTPAGTTVTVALATLPDPGPGPGAGAGAGARTGAGAGVVELSVIDDGPGIPRDLQPALFERFVRGDGARGRGGGSTGLGLAIVEAVVAAHGGKVAVASRPGRTQFTITLPRLPAAPPPGPAQPAAGPAKPAGTEPGVRPAT